MAGKKLDSDANVKKAGAVEILENKKSNHLEKDVEGILLTPEKNELAVLNPAIPQTDFWPKPFLYRTELPNPDPNPNTFLSFSKRAEARKYGIPDAFGRHSVINLKWLKSPTEFTNQEKQTIIFPENDYEKSGCEDPRITSIEGKYYITYVGFDGTNALVALAITTDFQKIEKKGILSPKISLEKLIDLVNDKDYKNIWAKRLKGFCEENKYSKNRKILYPIDKDAFLEKNRQWELFHRLGNYMQISKADRLEDFQDQDYWEEQIKNIKQSTVMKNKAPWIKEDWASEKIGWGSQIIKIGDKDVVLWHGVKDENGTYKYYGSFLEIKNGKIVSVIRDPLFEPISDDNFTYFDKTITKTKKVIFPTAAIIDENSGRLWVYSGSGDKKIKYRSTDIHWIYNELNNPCNRVIQPH